MVLYVHSIVHAALKDAMRWNRAARNVADAATPPPVGSTLRARRTTWTAAQLGAFLDFIAEDRYLTPWIFLATTGCRRGECLGLRWADLDLDGSTAIVSRQVTSIDHEIVVKDLPQTKRGHMVALDSNTVAMLRRWRAQQNEERLLVGPGYLDEDYVLCKPRRTVYDRTASAASSSASRTSTPRAPRRATAEADAPRPAPHLGDPGTSLTEGIDIKVVSDRLNHSSTFVTREIYTHVTPPMQSDAAERAASRIFGGPAGSS